MVDESGKLAICGSCYDLSADGLFCPLMLEMRAQVCIPEDILALESDGNRDSRIAECEVLRVVHFVLRFSIPPRASLGSPGFLLLLQGFPSHSECRFEIWIGNAVLDRKNSSG